MRNARMGWAGEIREVGCHRVFAFLSAGADTNASTLKNVRTLNGILQRSQRRVAFEPLCERGSSFWTELVVREPAVGMINKWMVSRVNGR